MKEIISSRYKMADQVFNFEHNNRYLDEPFTINRGGKIFHVVAPYSASGVIISRPVSEFKGDDLREDNYESRHIDSIDVYIGDIEQVLDFQGNSISLNKFIITPQDKDQMEKEVKEFYRDWV